MFLNRGANVRKIICHSLAKVLISLTTDCNARHIDRSTNCEAEISV